MQSLGDMRDCRPEKLFLAYRQKGDVKALGRLFDQLSPELLAVARHLSGDAAEAEDLVQAVFLAALEHPERYDESRPLTAWFVGILKNQALAWRRSAARSPDADRALEAQTASEEKARPDRRATDGESAGLIRAALAKLPEKYRAVLEPHLGRGQSPSAIARELGASPATVRVQLHRGLAQLRDLLPAGIAGGLALTLTERGLAQVRTEITTHASTLTPFVAAKTGGSLVGIQLGGLLMTQRILLGTLGLFVILTAAFLGREALWPESADSAPALTSVGLQESDPDIVLVSVEASVREEASGQDALEQDSIDDTASLLVRTVWSDGSPAANISFDYILFGPEGVKQRAKSDGSGIVLLDGLGAGHYGLYGIRSGHVSVQVRTATGNEAEGRVSLINRTTLRLADGIDVKGFVLDAKGQGVGGADIWITNALAREVPTVVGKSAPDGSFHIERLLDEGFIGARKNGFLGLYPEHVGTWAERYPDRETVEFNLTLERSDVKLRGVVLDPKGQPIAGARVRVGSQTGFDTMGPDGPVGPQPPREVITDEEGVFHCGGLMAGMVQFACKAPGFAVSAGRLRVAGGEIGRVEIRLEPGAWIRGLIRTPDGSPAAKVLIQGTEKAFSFPRAASSFASPRTETDGEGRFELGPLAAGQVRIMASTYDGKQKAHREGEVANGASYQWDHTLVGLPTISGRAVDVDGKGLGRWVVVARSMDGFNQPSKSVVCDLDGAFKMHVIGEKPRRLELHKPASGGQAGGGWAQRGAPFAWLDDVQVGSTQVRLVLNPEQAPTGKISGGLESYQPLGTTKIAVRSVASGLGIAELHLPPQTHSFEIPDLPEGRFTIRIESMDCAVLWLRDIELEKNQQLDLGTLLLQEGGALRVDLNAADPGSLDHAMVELFDQENNAWYVTMRAMRVEARNLPAGEYTLKVLAAGCGPTNLKVNVAVGERTETSLDLVPGGSIGIVLLDAKDRPLHVPVRLVVTQQDGMLVLEDSLAFNEVSRWFFAPFGELTVVAEAADGRRCEATLHFTVDDGAGTPHKLKLR
ncbi:MAG: sigma-70 family RNA polymerase sigma factor [Planctomycetota bacterium]|nr:sigma-70 family RNA polymerase sigma factor [Planctomycetota bacterium]